jgi:hypothetical protein
MRTGYSHTKETAAPIAGYLAVCMFVYGLFGFGFYNMFQPHKLPNPIGCLQTATRNGHSLCSYGEVNLWGTGTI